MEIYPRCSADWLWWFCTKPGALKNYLLYYLHNTYDSHSHILQGRKLLIDIEVSAWTDLETRPSSVTYHITQLSSCLSKSFSKCLSKRWRLAYFSTLPEGHGGPSRASQNCVSVSFPSFLINIVYLTSSEIRTNSIIEWDFSNREEGLIISQSNVYVYSNQKI